MFTLRVDDVPDLTDRVMSSAIVSVSLRRLLELENIWSPGPESTNDLETWYIVGAVWVEILTKDFWCNDSSVFSQYLDQSGSRFDCQRHAHTSDCEQPIAGHQVMSQYIYRTTPWNRGGKDFDGVHIA